MSMHGGTVSLVFIVDVTAVRSSRMNCKVSVAVFSDQIEPNTKLIKQGFTVQMDNDPKHRAKATQDKEAKKLDILLISAQQSMLFSY